VSTPSILGMPLDLPDDDPIAGVTPLSGFVVVKALDEDGDLCYFTAATSGLTGVECLGMAELAVLKVKRSLGRLLDDE